MTDKQLPPDWAIAKAWRELVDLLPEDAYFRPSRLHIEQRARELSTQQQQADDVLQFVKDYPAQKKNFDVMMDDILKYGMCIQKNGVRIDPADVYFSTDGLSAEVQKSDAARGEHSARDGAAHRTVTVRNGTVVVETSIADLPDGEYYLSTQPPQPARDGDALFWADRLDMLAESNGCGALTMKTAATLLRQQAQPPQPADGEAVPFGHVYRVANRDSLRPWTATGVVFAMGPAPDVEDSFPIQYLNLYLRPTRGVEVTEEMVNRGAALSTTGRKDDPKYRAKIRSILQAALSGVQR